MSKKIAITPKPSRKKTELDDWVGGGEEPVETKTEVPMRRFSFDMPVSLHQRMKLACVEEGINMKDRICKILEKEFPEKE